MTLIIPLKRLVKTLIEFFEYYKSAFTKGKNGIKITEIEYARITCLILILITLKPIEFRRNHLDYLSTYLVDNLTYSSFDSTRSKFVLRKKKKKYKIIEITWALFCLNRLIFLIPQLIEFIGSSSLEKHNEKCLDSRDNIIYQNVAEIFSIINNSSSNIIIIMTFVMFNHLVYTPEKKKAFLSNISTKKRKILLSKVTKKQLSSMVSKLL